MVKTWDQRARLVHSTCVRGHVYRQNTIECGGQPSDPGCCSTIASPGAAQGQWRQAGKRWGKGWHDEEGTVFAGEYQVPLWKFNPQFGQDLGQIIQA